MPISMMSLNWLEETASRNDKIFILRPNSLPIFTLLQQIKREFNGNPRPQNHVDQNEEQ
jgi:hypothetical protein